MTLVFEALMKSFTDSLVSRSFSCHFKWRLLPTTMVGKKMSCNKRPATSLLLPAKKAQVTK